MVESVNDVVAFVKNCGDTNQALTPVGGGTRLHIGHPPTREVLALSTLYLNKITDYVPEDLVVVAEAGITLSDLQKTLRQNGNWLPIDVAAPDRQTLGGIVAARANSTLRAGYGSVRDWLVGCELVNASAEIVVGGGKVVKNVAGYDLPRLYCGSWGTLGVLTKVNFKVSPLPESDRSMLVVLASDRNAEELLDSVLSKHNPTCAILFNSLAAERLLGPESSSSQYLFVRFMGLAEDVDQQIDRASIGASPYASSVVLLPEQIGANLFRLLTDFPLDIAPLSAAYHILPSQVGAYVRMVEWIAARHGLIAQVIADTSSGIVNAHFYEDDEPVDWPAFIPLFMDKATRVGGSLTIERMPESWREAKVPVWSPILDDFRLMSLIKQKLDPNHLFNPGRFMGGI